ncbi:CotH kinase family protein [Butyrivibrio sp. AE3004]|uniref:CotH kinase family protein n=1 Tax=Butyrivibrio sp. AE3004 TaxID=1506994 RepID=UPI00049402AF|nr:CotH kinase family protein [Butyrivibrio sp. AE3004]
MSLKEEGSNDNKKIDKKDLIIIIISAISLILLLLIILISRNRDRLLSEALKKNRDITAEELLVGKNSGADEFLKITEVSGEKWVELHNAGTEKINLSGIEIFVSGRSVAKVEDDIELKKDAYFAVDISVNPGSDSSNVLSIYNKDGKQLISTIIPKLTPEQSYGLADDETNKWGYIAPSKGKINSAKELKFVQYNGISFSAPGGFYDESFSLELGADEGEIIYYTVDGTRPTNKSDVYDSEIKISNKSGSNYVYAKEGLYNRLSSGYSPRTVDAGMIVRAIAVDGTGKVTKEASQSYFIGLTKDTDYFNLPIISVTIDPENLFDYEDGIYIAGKAREDALIQDLKAGSYGNYLSGEKKRAKVEFYEANKGKSFESDLDMSILADSSCYDKQKGLEFDLGENDYSDFEGSGVINYISSLGKMKLQQNYDDNVLKVRNHIFKSIVKDMEIGTIDSQPCVLFIDGEYWGLYNLTAYVDEKYIVRNFGVAGKEILFHNAQGYTDDFWDFYTYATNTDLSMAENYENIKSLMDIDNYIDFVGLNIYVGNSEFSSYGGTAWRTADNNGTGKADGKWRFICGDMSNTMYLSSKQTPTINSYLQSGIRGDILLQSLLMNEEFCKQFNDRMSKIISEIFTEEKCTASIDEVVKLVKKPALASYSRFYGGSSDKVYTVLVDNIRAFFEERTEYIKKYTDEFTANGGNLQLARELHAEMERKKKAEKSTIEDNEEFQGDEDETLQEGEEFQNIENNMDQNTIDAVAMDEENAEGESAEGETMQITNNNANIEEMQNATEEADAPDLAEPNGEEIQEGDETNE